MSKISKLLNLVINEEENLSGSFDNIPITFNLSGKYYIEKATNGKQWIVRIDYDTSKQSIDTVKSWHSLLQNLNNIFKKNSKFNSLEPEIDLNKFDIGGSIKVSIPNFIFYDFRKK